MTDTTPPEHRRRWRRLARTYIAQLTSAGAIQPITRVDTRVLVLLLEQEYKHGFIDGHEQARDEADERERRLPPLPRGGQS